MPDEAALQAQGVPDGATLRLILTPLPEAAGGALASSSGAAEEEGSEEQGRARVCGDLGTLYARCGGIFGITGFVGRCMVKWMADATLDSNAAVATWHERAQLQAGQDHWRAARAVRGLGGDAPQRLLHAVRHRAGEGATLPQGRRVHVRDARECILPQ